MTKTLVIPWTNTEEQTILEDWEKFAQDQISLNELRAKYRGRSRSALQMKVTALRDRARTSNKSMIERLRNFGASDEDIQYILHGDKVKLNPDQVLEINNLVTTHRKVLVEFTAGKMDSSIRMIRKF